MFMLTLTICSCDDHVMDAAESCISTDTLQSASSDGGSTTTATSRSGSRLSSTGDGDDDDDDDNNNAWDADDHNVRYMLTLYASMLSLPMWSCFLHLGPFSWAIGRR